MMYLQVYAVDASDIAIQVCSSWTVYPMLFIIPEKQLSIVWLLVSQLCALSLILSLIVIPSVFGTKVVLVKQGHI